MIGIIDYGMGNLGSVSNACSFLGLAARVVTAPEELASCRAAILPGVGAFGDCMHHLRASGFDAVVRDWIAADRPFLGICLGLQVLYEGSEESPGVAGLGILSGQVKLFPRNSGLKVPQIGWNRVLWLRSDCPLAAHVPDGSYFYFVHSYYVPRSGAEEEVGVTCYGLDYVSAVWRGRMVAVQFHPEKSQARGLQVLRNFADWLSETE